LRKEFIPNWTSVEFEGFVNRIEVLLDDLWGRAERGVQGLGMCEDVWRRVLEVERVFWPVVDKEGETLL
jgi:thiaminase